METVVVVCYEARGGAFGDYGKKKFSEPRWSTVAKPGKPLAATHGGPAQPGQQFATVESSMHFVYFSARKKKSKLTLFCN